MKDISAFGNEDAKSLQHSLLEAMVLDPLKHPERSATTLARVIEVLGIVVNPEKDVDALVKKCREAAGNPEPFQPLAPSSATSVAAAMLESLSPEEAAAASDLIMESELSTTEVVELHRKFKIPVSHLEDDLLPVNGEGARIQDSKGRVYIDLDSNYSATNLGNSNDAIARGLYNQARLLISQKEDRIQVARARFLKEITPMMPPGLCSFYWQNSGGEAVDKALKIAKAHTGHTGVIAFQGGFHGRTHGAVAVTHNESYRKPFGLHQESWVHFAPFNELEPVEKLLKAGAAKSVILELIQGEEAGMRPATPEFARGLRELCDRYGAVMITDEVQTGFARVSDGPGQWFACQRYGITPDIMTIGKSFGGGYPVTAVVTTQEVSESMKPGYDGSTFGGTPMAMVSALIATRQMRAMDLTNRVKAMSQRFAEKLSEIDSPHLEGFRTLGLMIALDMDSAENVKKAQEKMKALGAHSSLSTGATMRLMPPLVMTEQEVDTVVNAFDRAIADL